MEVVFHFCICYLISKSVFVILKEPLMLKVTLVCTPPGVLYNEFPGARCRARYVITSLAVTSLTSHTPSHLLHTLLLY